MSILRSINEGFERRYGKLIDDRKSKEVEEKELTEAPIYGLEAQYDSRKSFGGKAQVETDNAGTETLYSYGTPVVKIVKGKVTLLPKWDSSATTLRHVKEFLKQHDLKAESKEQIAKDYGARVSESCKKGVKECDEKDNKGAAVRRPAMKEACRRGRKSLKEYKDMGQDLGEYQKWVDYDMKRYHKISDNTMDKIKKAGLTVVKDQYGDYEVIAHEPVRECDDKDAKKRAIVKEAVEGIRARKFQESKKSQERRRAINEAKERVASRKMGVGAPKELTEDDNTVFRVFEIDLRKQDRFHRGDEISYGDTKYSFPGEKFIGEYPDKNTAFSVAKKGLKDKTSKFFGNNKVQYIVAKFDKDKTIGTVVENS